MVKILSGKLLHIILFGLIYLFMFCCFGDCRELFAFSLQDVTEKDERLPSEVWSNVLVMRNTDFKDKTSFINIEDDVKKYIEYEIQRMESSNRSHSGNELYYLALLYSEIEKHEKVIPILKKFMNDRSVIKDPDLLKRSRVPMIEALIKTGKLEEAELNLAVIEAEKTQYVELLFMELAFAYMERGKKNKAFSFARKAISYMNAEIAGFMLDHILTQFLRYEMADSALLMVDDIIESMKNMDDKETMVYLRDRKKQIQMIGRPSPKIFRPGYTCIGAVPPPTKDQLADSIKIIYFWARWCIPCYSCFSILESLREQYKDDGLVIVGITRLYGKVEGLDKDIEGELRTVEETKLLNKILKDSNVGFVNILDQDHALANNMYATEIPHLVIIDEKGTVRFFQASPSVEKTVLEDVIDGLRRGD